MRIIPVIRQTTVAIALLCAVVTVSSYADDVVSPPDSVTLAKGAVVHAHNRALVLSEKKAETDYNLKLPFGLRQEIAHSTDVIFPEGHSLIIDGHEYLLVVVSQGSSHNSTGYCGAGAESTLYALTLSGGHAQVVFSSLVQSCLKNIYLDADGTKSPFTSISWDKTGRGFDILWMTDADNTTSSEHLRLVNGKFEPLIR